MGCPVRSFPGREYSEVIPSSLLLGTECRFCPRLPRVLSSSSSSSRFQRGLFLSRVHEDWESFIQTLRSHLEGIYFPDTVEEWMEENVNPHMDRLREFVRDFREVIRLNARPKALD